MGGYFDPLEELVGYGEVEVEDKWKRFMHLYRRGESNGNVWERTCVYVASILAPSRDPLGRFALTHGYRSNPIPPYNPYEGESDYCSTWLYLAGWASSERVGQGYYEREVQYQRPARRGNGFMRTHSSGGVSALGTGLGFALYTNSALAAHEYDDALGSYSIVGQRSPDAEEFWERQRFHDYTKRERHPANKNYYDTLAAKDALASPFVLFGATPRYPVFSQRLYHSFDRDLPQLIPQQMNGYLAQALFDVDGAPKFTKLKAEAASRAAIGPSPRLALVLLESIARANEDYAVAFARRHDIATILGKNDLAQRLIAARGAGKLEGLGSLSSAALTEIRSAHHACLRGIDVGIHLPPASRELEAALTKYGES